MWMLDNKSFPASGERINMATGLSRKCVHLSTKSHKKTDVFLRLL
jgi:hypothetical protein